MKSIHTFLSKTYLYVLLIPILFIALGTISNQVVLNANNGTFPVMRNQARWNQGKPKVVLPDGNILTDPIHSVMTSETHLNFLADIIDMQGGGIWSIGDFFIDWGQWMWVFAPYLWGAAVTKKLHEG